jgi:CRISPR-associated protein Cmr2
MTDRHLLLVSIGPVQDFIAQARRSRDLWFGSHLLSELSRAAAYRLAEDGAGLIFPALARGDPELVPCDPPTRDGATPPLSIGNKILAEIPANRDPRACAGAAREAVRTRWQGIADRVRRDRAAILAFPIDQVWHEQVEDALEFYAVWVPLGDNYKQARRAAEQALAGRKNLREFQPWRYDRPGAPKSSLDGARVSVLGDARDKPEFRRLRIGDGEQLDAIGLIKRAGFEPEQFVPIVNVAAGAWLAKAATAAPGELAALRAAGRDKNIPRIDRRLPVVAPFRFDASILYPSRWSSSFKELNPPQESQARDWGNQYVRPLLKAVGGEPPAYVACLVADGDRMGAALDQLVSADDNRRFSTELAKFPAQAREIVEQRHNGSLIYAGGDDVLAFLPVATAPRCAAELAQSFKDCLKGAVGAAEPPTLSVGLGIGHFMEPMSLLLDLARRAERAAKEAGRNALAIIVDKRSGGERRVVMPWSDDPITRFAGDARLLANGLSVGKVHELETLVRRFPDPARDATDAETASALASYAEGALRHTGQGAPQRDPPVRLADIGVPRTKDYRELRNRMVRAIDRLLVVRSLREWGFA